MQIIRGLQPSMHSRSAHDVAPINGPLEALWESQTDGKTFSMVVVAVLNCLGPSERGYQSVALECAGALDLPGPL